MYGDLLPIGSVVLLKGAEVRLMIVGRILSDEKKEAVYDYAGCVYPIGLTDSNELYFFNRDAIERIFFVGFQDGEELSLREEVLSQLGELKIVNGKIVPVEE